MNKVKKLGQIFTPSKIVNQIMDEVGYNSSSIIYKYILEPSFGDGRFIIEIVNRYINEAINLKMDYQIISNNLNKFIHGVEIDNILYEKTINKLNNLTLDKINLKVNWDNLLCIDILDYQSTIKFDFIVGNPPYISIHNISPEQKIAIRKNNIKFFQRSGNLFIIFFEIGINKLKDDGKLGFITPNTYLFNQSFHKFRKYLKDYKLIKKIIDFKSEKIFDDASVYSAITIINKDINNNIIYKTEDNEEIIPIDNLNIKLGGFIEDNSDKDVIGKHFNIQYGLATLADKIFIDNNVDINLNEDLVQFNGYLIEKSILKPIVKASKYNETYKTSYIIFPYIEFGDNTYVPMDETYLKENFINTYNYLIEHKDKLENRSLDERTDWFLYGRSQGLRMINNDKYIISTITRDKLDIHFVPEGVFMYSGMYITKKSNDVSWDLLLENINTDEFNKYLKNNSKSLSNDYLNINSKLIKNYPIKRYL